MADRYWVGGTGTWDTTTTTNWSASSGGAGGASAPTSADNVFFNTLSNATAYTVTVSVSAVCADMTMAGPLTGNVTWAGAGTLNISGSATVASTGVTRTYTGAITFSATTTGKTITIGPSLVSAITINGVGGGWTLGAAFSTTGVFTIQVGIFDTSAASNYSLTCGSITATGAGTAALNLNASTVNLTSLTATSMTGAGFTINAGTSQINFTNVSGATLTSSGRTFYNVAFTGVAASTSNIAISGANTFNNLAFTPPSNSRAVDVAFGANQTVNGTLSGSGGSEIRRISYRSDVLGTARVLTLANPVTLTNCDFRDITAATSAITATGGGNCGGNTNITGFPSPKTVYWVLSGTQVWAAAAWSTASGNAGLIAAANFPLAQDTAIFDNSSGTSLVVNQGSNGWNIGSIDMSSRTNAMTFSVSTGIPLGLYGDWKNGTGVTLAGTGGLTFTGRGNTQQILGNGVAFSSSLTVQNIGGTVQLIGALTLGPTLVFTHTNGTLDLQSYMLTTGLFGSTNSNTRTIAFGTGNITVNGTGTIWSTSNAANLTTTGTQIVNVSNNSATAATVNSGTMTEANSISFNFTTGTYALTHGAGSKRNLTFTGFSGTVSSTAQTIYGDLTLSATATYSTSANAWTFASTSGTPRTITTNGKTMDFGVTFDGVGGTWVLQDNLTVGVTRAVNHTNGTLDLNGKTFTAGAAYNVNAGTKNITFNGGTILMTAAGVVWSNTAPTGFTTTAGTGTGTISLANAAAQNFNGGGSTYNCTLNIANTTGVNISGANTFDNITNSVQPTIVAFPVGLAFANTFVNFNLRGTAGNLVSIQSTSAAAHYLTKTGGTVSCDYLSIQRSNASPSSLTWYAGANSVNAGLNSGWIFTAPPAGNYSITALNGSYAVSGQSATVSFGRLLSAQNGVYSVAGQVVDISVGVPPTPVTAIDLFVEIRSFTERRRF